MSPIPTKFINKIFVNKENEKFWVIEYFNCMNVSVKFEDGTIRKNLQSSMITHRPYGIHNFNFKNSPNYVNIPTFYNIGYIGVGKFNSKNNNYYNIWAAMFSRCYSKKQPSYIDCIIDPIWHNFQNFANWCEINYIPGFVIDKDIIIKGNKIYSPETCCFVPSQINQLFVKRNKLRGLYPIGVCLEYNKYKASINIFGIQKHLGLFETIDEAFSIYKIEKEKYIKTLANYWKNKISEICFQSMYNYKVEITD